MFPDGENEMIHFQCRCGTTLSAEEGAAGENVRCVSCGHELAVPARGPARGTRPNGSRPNGGRDTGSHDFDAEITGAARSAPPRPRKTPRKVDTAGETPSGSETEGTPEPVPGYDLMGVAAWAERLGPVSWLFLALFAAGAGGCFELLDGATSFIIAGLLVVLGVTGCVALRILREVCRATLGLAAQQREMAANANRRRP